MTRVHKAAIVVRMVPRTPSRMDGYVRVSRVMGRAGESFISPKQQREQIQGWAKLRGVHIDAWHEDLDQSGGKLARPGLEDLLARIDAGETEGVVVAKLDRLSRLGVGDALKLVERITEAGGTISAVDLGIDPTTPFGEFGMTIMLGLARMERRRIADMWSDARARAVKRGVSIGRPELGYIRQKDGTLEVDPDTAPKVREAYRRAARDGLAEAQLYLAREFPHRRWTSSKTRSFLGSRTYMGEVRAGELVNAEAHKPIVTRAEWEAAQTTAATRRPSRAYPLSGVATCACCDEPLVGCVVGSPSTRGYRCKSYATGKCQAPAVVTAELLEQYAREVLRSNWDPRVVEVSDQPQTATGEAQEALETAEAELLAFASDLGLRRALGGSYHEMLDLRVQARDKAREEFRTAAKEAAETVRVIPTELLDSEDPEDLRELLRAAFKTISVVKGRGSIESRVTLLDWSDQPVTFTEEPKARRLKAV